MKNLRHFVNTHLMRSDVYGATFSEDNLEKMAELVAQEGDLLTHHIFLKAYLMKLPADSILEKFRGYFA